MIGKQILLIASATDPFLFQLFVDNVVCIVIRRIELAGQNKLNPRLAIKCAILQVTEILLH
jgi:hypothetical protein